MLNNYCLNCEKLGHVFKECTRPITSYGIICFNLNKKYNINNDNVESLFYNKFIDIMDYNYNNLDNLHLIPNYLNDIKILMVRRKYSLTYIEFIRGKYNINNLNEISKLFKLMSYTENVEIKTQEFDILWNKLWIDTANNKIFRKEYISAEIKFNTLKKNNFFMLLENNELSTYTEPEWGFPKGRKEYMEKYIDCALREFKEETNIDNIHLLNRVNYIDEDYIGSNNVNYRSIYYLGYHDNTDTIYNPDHTYEIGDMKWMTIKECLNSVRLYDDIKKNILNSVYFFIVNLLHT
jgi:8-oxo-dGTP pyrophosphatase MutT (NUDIX family)